MWIFGEGVQCAHCSLDDLVHSHAVSECCGLAAIRSHAVAVAGLLVGLVKQLHQSRYGTVFAQWGVIGSAQRKITNQTNAGFD